MNFDPSSFFNNARKLVPIYAAVASCTLPGWWGYNVALNTGLITSIHEVMGHHLLGIRAVSQNADVTCSSSYLNRLKKDLVEKK